MLAKHGGGRSGSEGWVLKVRSRVRRLHEEVVVLAAHVCGPLGFLGRDGVAAHDVGPFRHFGVEDGGMLVEMGDVTMLVTLVMVMVLSYKLCLALAVVASV